MKGTGFMSKKKVWITSGAAALLLVAGGVTAFTVSGEDTTAPAPMPSSQKIEALEEKFGAGPTMPSSDELKKQLVEVEKKIVAPPTDAPTEAATGSGGTTGTAASEEAWIEAELLKQQIVFADLAPKDPPPTPHSKVATIGTPPAEPPAEK